MQWKREERSKKGKQTRLAPRKIRRPKVFLGSFLAFTLCPFAPSEVRRLLACVWTCKTEERFRRRRRRNLEVCEGQLLSHSALLHPVDHGAPVFAFAA